MGVAAPGGRCALGAGCPRGVVPWGRSALGGGVPWGRGAPGRGGGGSGTMARYFRDTPDKSGEPSTP